METTIIQVVVPTLGDRSLWLRDALLSIRRQQVNARVDICIVAPSSANLSSLAAEVAADVIYMDKPGLSAAINEGWRQAKDGTALVSWLGDDDLLAPGSLSWAVSALEKNDSASMVYGDVRYIDDQGLTLWLQRSFRMAQYYMRVGKNLVPQQGSLLRLRCVRAVDYLDETLQSAMDQDLFTKLQKQGPLLHLRQEMGAFRIHSASITSTKGIKGESEAALVRSRYKPGFARLLAPIIPKLDRILCSVIRRMPFSAPPHVVDQPYTKLGLASWRETLR